MIPNGARYTGLIVVRLDSLDGLITRTGALARLNARDKLFSQRETKLSNRISVPDATRPVSGGTYTRASGGVGLAVALTQNINADRTDRFVGGSKMCE